MRNDFCFPANQVIPTTVPSADFFGKLDKLIVASPNGDGGSTHAPRFPIGIGGQGVQLATASQIQGGVRTDRGGRCVLGNNDWPNVSPARPRSIVMPLRRNQWRVSSDGTNSKTWGVVGGLTGGVTGEQFIFAIPSRLLHHNATLVSVVIRFRVGQPHPSVPATMPSMLLVSTDLNAAATVLGASGFAAPGTGDLWFNNGDPQSLTLDAGSGTPLAPTVIDTKANMYGFTIVDEHGANSLVGNIFHSATFNFTSIGDLRPA